MYGLTRAGIISHGRLKKHLENHGYQPVKSTPVLWNHKSIPISFTLIIGGFGNKYVGNQNSRHIFLALK